MYRGINGTPPLPRSLTSLSLTSSFHRLSTHYYHLSTPLLPSASYSSLPFLLPRTPSPPTFVFLYPPVSLSRFGGRGGGGRLTYYYPVSHRFSVFSLLCVRVRARVCIYSYARVYIFPSFSREGGGRGWWWWLSLAVLRLTPGHLRIRLCPAHVPDRLPSNPLSVRWCVQRGENEEEEAHQG